MANMRRLYYTLKQLKLSIDINLRIQLIPDHPAAHWQIPFEPSVPLFAQFTNEQLNIPLVLSF
jgi:hypothetical protein